MSSRISFLIPEPLRFAGEKRICINFLREIDLTDIQTPHESHAKYLDRLLWVIVPFVHCRSHFAPRQTATILRRPSASLRLCVNQNPSQPTPHPDSPCRAPRHPTPRHAGAEGVHRTTGSASYYFDVGSKILEPKACIAQTSSG